LPVGNAPGVRRGPAAEEESLPDVGLADRSRIEGRSAARVDGQRLIRVHIDLIGLVQRLALVARALPGEVAAGLDAWVGGNSADDVAGRSEGSGQVRPGGRAPATMLSVPPALWLVTRCPW